MISYEALKKSGHFGLRKDIRETSPIYFKDLEVEGYHVLSLQEVELSQK